MRRVVIFMNSVRGVLFDVTGHIHSIQHSPF